MKITVAKQDLVAALDVVAPCMASSGADLSTHFLFRRCPTDPNKMEVLTYDKRTSASCPMIAQIEGDGEFTIPGSSFKAWLGFVPDVALEITFENNVVNVALPAKYKRASPGFRSLDPKNFPFWDEIVKETKLTAKMPPARLSSAIHHSLSYTSEDDTKSVENNVCEVKNGVFYSTDRISACALTVKGMEGSATRIARPDGKCICDFLKTFKTPVEIWESDRSTYFKRDDGAVVGETRAKKGPQLFQKPDAVDNHLWKLSNSEIKQAIGFVREPADPNDTRLRVSRPDPNGGIVFAMYDLTGKLITAEVECLESVSAPDAPAIPTDGFVLAYPALLKTLDLYDGETIKLGVNVLGKKGGFIRVIDTRFADDKGQDGDEYLTLIAWLK